MFLDDKIISPFSEQSLESKFEFIRSNVYAQRSWNTWLKVEWEYRTQLDDLITIDHVVFDWAARDNSKEKYLFLMCNDESLPFVHYFHVNPAMNNLTPDEFIKKIRTWKRESEVFESCSTQFPNKKLVTIDSLYGPELSYTLYKEIVDFFGFSDNFEVARQVHAMHYQCRKQSAKDFYDYFTSNEFMKILNDLKVISDGDN